MSQCYTAALVSESQTSSLHNEAIQVLPTLCFVLCEWNPPWVADYNNNELTMSYWSRCGGSLSVCLLFREVLGGDAVCCWRTLQQGRWLLIMEPEPRYLRWYSSLLAKLTWWSWCGKYREEGGWMPCFCAVFCQRQGAVAHYLYFSIKHILCLLTFLIQYIVRQQQGCSNPTQVRERHSKLIY